MAVPGGWLWLVMPVVLAGPVIAWSFAVLLLVLTLKMRWRLIAPHTMASGIAYDPSGETALPMAQQSAEWQASASDTELGIGSTEVRRNFGSYYCWFHF